MVVEVLGVLPVTPASEATETVFAGSERSFGEFVVLTREVEFHSPHERSGAVKPLQPERSP